LTKQKVAAIFLFSMAFSRCHIVIYTSQLDGLTCHPISGFCKRKCFLISVFALRVTHCRRMELWTVAIVTAPFWMKREETWRWWVYIFNSKFGAMEWNFGDEKKKTLALKVSSYICILWWIFPLFYFSSFFLLLLLLYFSSSIATVALPIESCAVYWLQSHWTTGLLRCHNITRNLFPPPRLLYPFLLGAISKRMYSRNVKTYIYMTVFIGMGDRQSERRRAAAGTRVIGNFIRLTKCQNVEIDSRIKRIEILAEREK
jgi:hypothetical protein